jgi:hypothetical protein
MATLRLPERTKATLRLPERTKATLRLPLAVRCYKPTDYLPALVLA